MGPQASQTASNVLSDPQRQREADNRAVIERGKLLHTNASKKVADNFRAMAEDLEMVAGGERQWDSKALLERKRYGRPVVSSNRLRSAGRQVVGEVYKAPPAIKCSPADGAASPAISDALEGITRYIERRSGARQIYPMVAQSTTDCGVGHMRLKLKWAEENNLTSPDQIDRAFDTELLIELISNQFSVLWDPNSKDPQYSDAKECLVISDLDEEQFRKAYPEAGSAGWAKANTYASVHNWHSAGGKVTVAEYWEVKFEPAGKAVRLVHTKSGMAYGGRDPFTGQDVWEQVPPTGAERILKDPSPELLQEAEQLGFVVVQERELFSRKICMHLLGGNDVLSGPHYWPGERIPIFTCEGQVTFIGDERIVQGLVRDAKDDQRRLNYALATELELLSMAPKSPWLLEDEMIKGYEDEWTLAAKVPAPWLRYKKGSQGAKPERQDPVTTNPGLMAAKADAIDGIKATSGYFDASIGNSSREISGVAIEARDAQADTGSFVFVANLNRTVEVMGQEIITVAPKIMRDRQMITILGEDDTPGILDLAQLKAQGLGLDLGRYLVICNPGPSYQSQRDKDNDLFAKTAQALAGSPAAIVPMIYQAKNMQIANKDEYVGDLVAVLAQGGIVLPSMQPAQPQAPPELMGMPGAPPGAPLPPEQMMPPQAMGFDPMQAAPDFPPGRAPASFERVAPPGRAGMQGAYN